MENCSHKSHHHYYGDNQRKEHKNNDKHGQQSNSGGSGQYKKHSSHHKKTTQTPGFLLMKHKFWRSNGQKEATGSEKSKGESCKLSKEELKNIVQQKSVSTVVERATLLKSVLKIKQ